MTSAQEVTMKTLRIITLSLLILLSTFSIAEAQTTITANGQLCEDGGGCYPFTLTFNPKGGAVTGVFKAASGDHSVTANFSGTFAGGDGGAVNGKVTGQGTTAGKGTTSVNGTWNGVFRADGKGEGKWEWTADYTTNGTWSVTYSAAAFRSALGTGAPTPSPTPGLWDLSVQKIVALQAVEGAKFVTGKAAAVRVFVAWPDPTTTLNVNVELQMNGTSVGRKTQQVKNKYTAKEIADLKNSFNFFIPADAIRSGTNTFTARASLGPLRVGQEQIKDPNPANNEKSISATAYATRGISVLVVATHKNVGVKEMSNFLAEAYPYINSVYPMRVSIPPYFYRSEHLYFDTAMHNVIALEEARQLYASQSGKIASYAVGLYPPNYYGADTHGMSFWWNRRSVLVEVTSPESMPHEIGHGLGGADEYSSTEPGKFLPQVNIYRSNVGSLEDLSALAASRYINFMGNAGKSPPTWVDVDMWNLLVDAFKIGAGYRPANGLAMILPQDVEKKVDGFLIKGLIGKNDSIQVSPPMWLQNLSPSPNNRESDYVLSVADQKGIETTRVPVYIDLKESDPAPFIAVLPAPRDATTLFLRRGGKLLGKWTRSANPPQVKLNAPSRSGNSVTLAWQATDADKDALSYTVLFSNDGGASWLTAATELKEPRLTLDTTNMPGCDRCLARVLTSDGWNTTSADISAPFAVENKAPSISIVSPRDGATVSLDMPIVFSAAAFDMEDGLLDEANVIWRSDKDGELGKGNYVMTSALSAGAHTITVTTKDKAGAQAQKSVKIMVSASEVTAIPSLTATPDSKVAPTLAATPAQTPTPNDDLISAITYSLIAGGVVLLCGLGLFGVGAVFWMMRRS